MQYLTLLGVEVTSKQFLSLILNAGIFNIFWLRKNSNVKIKTNKVETLKKCFFSHCSQGRKQNG